MTDNSSNQLNAGVLPGIGDARFRSDSTAPEGILVENMRRRGIDRMRLTFAPPRRPTLISRLLGRKKSMRPSVVTETLTIADQSILVDLDARPKKKQRNKKDKTAKPIPFVDVKSVEICSKGGEPALALVHGSTTLVFGSGLGEEPLRWLRDRLMLEIAGLVWKPVFHVGRRSTRKVSSAEDDVYNQWQGGSNRLIDCFLEEAPAKATALEAALGTEKWDDAKKALHWLKSSCASVGAVQLSDLCQRIEVEIEIHDRSRIRVLGASFAMEFNKVIATLEGIRRPADGSSETTAEENQSGVETATDQPLAGMRILIAEDSKVNQALACDYLEEAGAEVGTASDGREAVDKYLAEPFDLILMDCQMPNVDGFEATRLIRQNETRMNRMPIPIIALTAQTLRDDRSNCLNAGMSDHLGKPYTQEEIIEISVKWCPQTAGGDAGAETAKDDTQIGQTEDTPSETADAPPAPELTADPATPMPEEETAAAEEHPASAADAATASEPAPEPASEDPEQKTSPLEERSTEEETTAVDEAVTSEAIEDVQASEESHVVAHGSGEQGANGGVTRNMRESA